MTKQPAANLSSLTLVGKYHNNVIENNYHLAIKMKISGKKAASLLRKHGYRLTPQRRAVLDAVILSREHFTSSAVYEGLRREHPGLGLVTVYRTLELLADIGLLCEVHTGGRQRSFIMRRPSEHHHHLICSACGKVIDFADCKLNELESKLSSETGFVIDSHLLELHGHCRDCR